MTPKAKADELIEKYYQMLKDTLEVNSAFYYCKQCAIIAVYEILNVLNSAPIKNESMLWKSQYEFYQQVRTEIENL